MTEFGLSLLCLHTSDAVRPLLSDHIKQLIFFLAFQTGGCLLLRESESSAEGSCMSSLHFFHSAVANRLSTVIFMSPE